MAESDGTSETVAFRPDGPVRLRLPHSTMDS
jgi:hypothetical protein